MDRTVPWQIRGLSMALVLTLAQACGDGGGQEGTSQRIAAQRPAKPAADAPAPKAAGQRQIAVGSSTEQVRNAVRERVVESGRSLDLEDPRSGEALELLFDFIHTDVRSTPGGRHVVCTDFHTAGGTPYDVDYYVRAKDGRYVVEDVVMHKADQTAVLPDERRTLLDSAS